MQYLIIYEVIKMDLEKRCKEGSIPVNEFFQFVVGAIPRRTHYLDVGDYVVIARPYQEDHINVEEIVGLNSPEKGNFITVQGTTGPISGNVFIKIDKKGFPKYLLIEGDNVDIGNRAVYDVLDNYLRERCKHKSA